MMEEPIDEIPDVESPGLPSQSRLRIALPKSCLRRPVTGLVDSGQKTSEGHATHGIADQTRWNYRPDPVQDDKTTSPRKPGTQ